MEKPLEFAKLVRPAFDPAAVGSSRSPLPPLSSRQAGGASSPSNDSVSSSGPFLIHEAAHEGDLRALKSLLRSEPSFNPYDSSMRTPLYYSAAAGNLECVEALCSARGDIIDLGDEEGDTALHIASYYGHTDILVLLLQFKASVNKQNTKGFTPLHVCSSVECCKLLMDYGADPFMLDTQGRNPLFSACATDKMRVVGEILNYPRYDAREMIKMQDCFGDSALHAAACNGSLDCVKALKGWIDIEVIRMENNRGLTAEDLAKMNQQQECAEYIHELMITLYKSQDDLLRSNDPRRFSMFHHQTNNWFPGNRPGTAGGAFHHQDSAMRGFYQRPSEVMLFGRQTTYAQRPQSAQSYVNDTVLPAIGMEGMYDMYDERDMWNVFSKPYEDPSAYETNAPYAMGAMMMESEEDRPKTPWTLRRERGIMGDWHGEWAQFIDEETNQPFWWNAISGECQWETPERIKLAAEHAYDATGFQQQQEQQVWSPEEVSEAEQIRQRSFVLDRIGSWSECQDSMTGDVFYYNNETGECEWELPPDVEEERQRLRQEKEEQLRQEAEAEAKEWLLNLRKTQQADITSQLEEKALAEAGWTKVRDEHSGSNYFLNKATGETTWDEPAAVRVARETLQEQKRNDEMEQLKEKIKAEAAAQIAEQVKAAISSTEEERERIRKEFDEKMKLATQQTEMLAKKLESETDAARKRKEAEILKLKEKEVKQEEKSRQNEEKAEILAEHGEELKQLASVLSADRIRQNEKLQEKLKERRRARALKRAQVLNQAKELKSPKSPTSPMRRIPMSPIIAMKMGLTPKNSSAVTPVEGLKTVDRKISTDSMPLKRQGPATMDDLFSDESVQCIDKARQQSEKFDMFVKVHVQYMPPSLVTELEGKGLNIGADKAARFAEVLWALFRTFAMENRKSALPNKLNGDALKLLLSQGNLKLPVSERESIVRDAFPTDDVKHLHFMEFLQVLLQVLDALHCESAAYCKATVLPVCLKACSLMDGRIRQYQKDSKDLATNQVRKILQVNVTQLKIIYMYYTLIAEKRKSPCPKKSLSLEEVILCCKDFAITPKRCSVRQLVQLYGDMNLRKPGGPGSLAGYALAFNQWVQLLFHISLRCFADVEKDTDATVGAEKKVVQAHLCIAKMLESMDQSGGKARIKAKGIQPFICVVAPEPETS